METMEGTISHLQDTVSVSGGGNNGQASTTYIALFRLDGQPVQFRCGKPIPFADDDRLKVAGVRRATDLYAFAARDMTTGAVLHAPIWGNVILAVILPLFGLIFSAVAATLLGKYAVLVFLLFLVGTIYLIVSAVRTSSALKLVRQ